MKKLILIFAMLIVLSFTVTAQADAMNAECEKALNMYDLEGKKIPAMVPYSNAVFNAYNFKDEPVAHLVIQDKKIVSYGCDVVDNPTYRVNIRSVNTIYDIQNSDEPMKEFNRKLKTREIQVKGLKVTKKVKWVMTKPLVKISSWFS